MLDLLKKDGKQPSFDAIIGMINAAIGTFTMGEHTIDSLTQEYMPKLIQGIKEYQDKSGSNPLMLNLMLSDDGTYLIASVYEMQADGGLDLKHSFPLNNITELLQNIKNLKTEDAHTHIEAEPTPTTDSTAASIQQPSDEERSAEYSTGAGADETGTGADTGSETGGLPAETDSHGAQA